jgi:glycine betaine/choline ABC-type transport system substrate-binding protein
MKFIKSNSDLVKALTTAQVKHTAELATDDHWLHSDDGYDYLQSALALSTVMLEILQTNDFKALDKMLNEPGNLLNEYACDGIASAFL